MKRWALIENAVVATVTEQASAPTVPGLWAECGDAGPGWAYDGATFHAPASLAPRWSDAGLPVEYRQITRLSFRSRFTDVEKAALDLASIDVPTAPMEQRKLQASLRVYLQDVSQATMIDLTLAKTRDGVKKLEALGLLAAGRASQILDAPTTDYERILKGLPQPKE